MFEKGHTKHGGRKKGTPNRTTAQLQEIYMRAFERRGGEDELVSLDPQIFYKSFGQLFPREIKASLSEETLVVIKRAFAGRTKEGGE